MFECKIIADSISGQLHRLTTFEITFPRIILSELNTHRILSRNSASSRAIPVEKMIKKVLEDPFIPTYWGKNQKGMSAEEEISEDRRQNAVDKWLLARDRAVQSCREILDLGIHKQITNRLLEPFMWHTALVSATSFENMFNLRDHKDAQPEFKILAGMMRKSYQEHVPVLREAGEWHLPLVKDEERQEIIRKFKDPFALQKVSSGRCCRVSYLTHNGIRDLDQDYSLAERLIYDGHMSPHEHAACNLNNDQWYGNFQGWKQYRKFINGENIYKELR